MGIESHIQKNPTVFGVLYGIVTGILAAALVDLAGWSTAGYTLPPLPVIGAIPIPMFAIVLGTFVAVGMIKWNVASYVEKIFERLPLIPAILKIIEKLPMGIGEAAKWSLLGNIVLLLIPPAFVVLFIFDFLWLMVVGKLKL